MGLDICVGYFAELIASNEDDGVRNWREIFASVNRTLHKAGLPPHHEPEELPPPSSWWWDMYGYSGLHYLRRIAAHLAAGLGMPPPGGDDAAKDPVLLKAYQADQLEVPPASVGASRLSLPTFDHLIRHSDCEGLYLPQEFESVLSPTWSITGVEIPGGDMGSVVTLQRECERLADVLEIPKGLSAESDEVNEAADQQGDGEGWRRYGVETLTCLQLIEACRTSLKVGAAIVFA